VKTIGEKFWSRVVRHDEGCWEWRGGHISSGYGEISDYKPLLAHRVSWELHYGPIPEGMGVLHHCDNKECSRPDHLFLGDARANARDLVNKGLHYSRQHPEKVLRGERHGMSKVTEEQVREIRELAGTMNQMQIAAKYGITHSAVSLIIRRKKWAHVS
jgi:hypothetical protein